MKTSTKSVKPCNVLPRRALLPKPVKFSIRATRAFAKRLVVSGLAVSLREHCQEYAVKRTPGGTKHDRTLLFTAYYIVALTRALKGKDAHRVDVILAMRLILESIDNITCPGPAEVSELAEAAR
jgi:hypothetical protein